MRGSGSIHSMIHKPLFVMEQTKLLKNLNKLTYLQEQSGIKILHTLKSFNQNEGLEIISKHLSGFSVGNSVELEMIEPRKSQHTHSYAPFFSPNELENIAKYSTTMSFNSLQQWSDNASIASQYSSIGLRINPQLTIKQPKYCNPNYNNRLGVPYKIFLENIRNPETFTHLEGLHFHAFCGQGLDGLKYLLAHISKEYSNLLPRLKWLNLGGGHNFTNNSYDSEGFIALINAFKSKNPHLVLIFEPGESVIKNTGYFRTTILDIIPSFHINNKKATKAQQLNTVILNTSIETHLLDIAITKQTPRVRGSTQHKTPYLYQLSGMSCIAGDIIGTYYFEKPLEIGENIIFEDMMGYTMVKQTEFNGIKKAEFLLV